MHTIKPILFSALILGALSATSTDAFARWGHHGHGGFGDFAAIEDRSRDLPRADDASKLHTVLRHPEESISGAATDRFHNPGPEVVTLGGAHGIVHEDDVGTAHPESKAKPKAMVCSSHNMQGC